MKTNIKMRVTPEQSKKVQEICFDNGIYWNDGSRWVLKENEPYLFILQKGALIYKSLNEYNEYNLRPEKEIDAYLFIRTNGTCEEKVLSEDCLGVSQYNIDMLQETILKQKEEIEFKNEIIKELEDLNRMLKQGGRTKDDVSILEQKLKKKNEILKKARVKRKNQREELHKLNLKLQKCISLEEHNKIIEKINKGNVNYLSNNIISRDKEIEKLKAVIEYLESKVQ